MDNKPFLLRYVQERDYTVLYSEYVKTTGGPLMRTSEYCSFSDFKKFIKKMAGSAHTFIPPVVADTLNDDVLGYIHQHYDNRAHWLELKIKLFDPYCTGLWEDVLRGSQNIAFSTKSINMLIVPAAEYEVSLNEACKNLRMKQVSCIPQKIFNDGTLYSENSYGMTRSMWEAIHNIRKGE